MFRIALTADGYKQGCFMRIESLRAIPQYAREYQFEVKAFAVGATASMLALKYLGKAEAVGIAGLAYAAYQYRDRISLLCQSAQNPHLLTLVGATASIPLIASVPRIGSKLVIPVAAFITLAFLNYDMKQRTTANGLSNNNGKIGEVVGVIKETTSITVEITQEQSKNNEKLSDLNTAAGEATSRLIGVVKADGEVAHSLGKLVKTAGEFFAEAQKDDLAKDIAAASDLAQQTEALTTEVKGLEKTVEQCDVTLSQAKQDISAGWKRLEALKLKRQQQTAQG
jgi:hypothetical protein